jgi:hypothetical protein
MYRQKKLCGICKTFSFLYLHIGLIPQFFLRRSHVLLLELCLCVVIFKTCVFNAEPHFTRTALHEHVLIAEINFRWGIVNISQHAYVSLVPSHCCRQVSPGSIANVPFSILLSSVLGLVACLSCSA